MQTSVDPGSTPWRFHFLKQSGPEESGVGAAHIPTPNWEQAGVLMLQLLWVLPAKGSQLPPSLEICYYPRESLHLGEYELPQLPPAAYI